MKMAQVKRIALALVALLIFAQFVQPKRTNPPVIPARSLAAHVPVPDQVQSVLNRACNDCHSNQTVWPWYSHIAPLSWFITDDVNGGRRHINFQDWDAQENPKQASDHLTSICKEVRDGGMPLLQYRIIHRDSRLTPQDIDLLCSWSQSISSASGSEVTGHQ